MLCYYWMLLSTVRLDSSLQKSQARATTVRNADFTCQITIHPSSSVSTFQHSPATEQERENVRVGLFGPHTHVGQLRLGYQTRSPVLFESLRDPRWGTLRGNVSDVA